MPPFNTIDKENKKFEWDENCQTSFEKLKTALTTAPVLAYPDENGSFILDTDACDSGISGILVQNSEERVIAYPSKTLTKSQTKYCTTHKELLPVVTFVKHFRHFLWGRKF